MRAEYEVLRRSGSRPPWEPTKEEKEQLTWWFHNLFFDDLNRTWANTFYRGYRAWQAATDLWIYQELIYEREPDLIIETGTGYGGCALYFADMLDRIGKGKVITVDDKYSPRYSEKMPVHKRIEYLEGMESLDPIVKRKMKDAAEDSSEVMVFLDSSHIKKYVYDEISFYSKLVKVGGYLIVEDTNIGDVKSACMKFLRENPEFRPDTDREKFYLTFHPYGYLERIE